MTTSRLASLLAVSIGTTLAAQNEDEATKLVATAREHLAKIEYTVPASIATSTRTAAEVIEDLDAQQEVLFPRGAFALQHALLQALGLRAGKDEHTLRSQTMAEMARGLSAYYDPIRKTFVLLPSVTRQVSEALSGSVLPLVTHELVHAHQDTREGGIVGFLAADQGSFDLVQARRCVLEGEAEVAAAFALHGEAGVRTLTGQGVSTLDKLFAGELTGTIYQAGRKVVASRFLDGGWPAVAKLWKDGPTSSEQVLHPLKLGVDLPTTIVVPPLANCEVLHTTTFGELMTYHFLRQLGLETEAASLASVGWDGDQCVVLAHGEAKAAVVVWRSVWDRDEDAAGFVAALPKPEHARLAVAGRIVDWMCGEGVAAKELDELFAALRAVVPTLPADPGAAASTAAVEEEVRAVAASTTATKDRWEHKAIGLSVPIPEGFEQREVQGVKVLALSATAKQGFMVNVNVQVQPRGEISDIEQVLAANRAQFESMPDLTVEVLEAARIGEADVVNAEFHGRIGNMTIHCLCVMYLRGDQQVVVTATAAPKQWKEHEAVLRKLMAGITIAP